MAEQSEVNEILLRILREGLLRIRVYGWNGRADQCAIEADHLHNLPSLILKPNPEKLVYYFDVTRVVFINEAEKSSGFQADWNRLEPIVQQARRKPD